MNISGDGMIVFEDFVEMMLGPSNIIQRAINQHLAIPDFQDFSKSLVEIFHSVQGIDEGELPGEVPALTKVPCGAYSLPQRVVFLEDGSPIHLRGQGTGHKDTGRSEGMGTHIWIFALFLL